jgi:hypothetical protein
LRAACHSGTDSLNLMLFVGGSAICANMPDVRQFVKGQVDFFFRRCIAWSDSKQTPVIWVRQPRLRWYRSEKSGSAIFC